MSKINDRLPESDGVAKAIYRSISQIALFSTWRNIAAITWVTTRSIVAFASQIYHARKN
jgi:hypothetical protein